MITAIAFVLLAFSPAAPVAVTSCGADPSGIRDSTSAFEDCLASLPAGDLTIPYGTYRLTRPIFKNRNQNLIGMGSKASILKCEAISACIVAADSAGGPNNYSGSQIQNLALEGKGADKSNAGILMGGDPKGKLITGTAFGDSVSLMNLRILGFAHVVEWGNNAWSNKIVQCAIFGNSSGLFVPVGVQNSGEAISITDSNIFNNQQYGIEDHGNFEWFIHGSSFDYNATAFLFQGSVIHITSCHFEQPSAQVFFQPYGQGSLSIRDSEILVQLTTGQDKYILSLWPQALNLAIDDVSIWSNHHVDFFMRVQGNITGVITNLHGNGNKKITALSDAPPHAVLSAIQAF